MMKTFYTILSVCVLLAMSFSASAQGVTTASMSGKITDAAGEALIGANIYAVHTPSGTAYGNSTDLDGRFRIPNMRVGGPYTITASYTGYGSQELTGITLRLGEDQFFEFTLQDNTTELTTVEVIGKIGSAGDNAGASTQISAEQIDALPTLNRDITDFVRLTPQSSRFGDGTSFAGTNNRYNAIYIDGAVNNDVFGLASSGTNGGQTGASPFSIDIIDQFQVVLSTYDVTLGGFAGGGINAVTKSGTNEFKGTAYVFNQNESIAGKTNGRIAERLGAGFEPTKLDEFNQTTFGASLGGPIIENKLFFFANVELQRDETPAPFEFGQYNGDATEADITALRNRLINEFNYDPGTFGATSDQLDAGRFFIKIDANLNQNNRLTVRHNYNKATNFNRNAGNSGRINFSNNGIFFPSTTNSSAIELNTTFGAKASNNLIVGYTRVNDNRDPLGDRFPNVLISDGNGSISFGSEAFSTGNLLEQSIFTITDNFKLYRGKQTFTFGTHNEFYSINNVFVRQNFGAYQFDSLEDFNNNAPASQYDRTYSLVDDVTGDNTKAAAQFNAIQLGFYAQDEVEVNKNLTVTAGIRVDIPIITDDPLVNPLLLTDSTLSKITNAWDIAGNVTPGSAPSGQLMFSPRLGFNYDFRNSSKTVLRGGVGIFTSRVPFVWPGGMFTNNGVTLGSVDERDLGGSVAFRPDFNNQYVNPNPGAPGGQVDLFVDDFKYPQVLRSNLGLDHELPGGFRVTVEGIFTKTLNNILLTSVNSDPTTSFNWTGGPDNRPVFSRRRLAPELNGDVYLASNTSEGYTYTITGQVAKNFSRFFDAQVSYTYGDANSINDGTSSQNSSNWRGQVNTDGRNNPAYGRSDYALGHRVVGNINYKSQWTGDDRFATTFSLFFDGQKGNPYSYILGPEGNGLARNPNNESGSISANRSLVYIPASQSDINLVDYTNSAGEVVTAASQWSQLNAFIESDDYLSKNRGGYAEKNGANLPFMGSFDVAIRQNIGFEVGGTLQRFQLSFDIFNVANLLNDKWGTFYSVPGGQFNNRVLYNVVGYEADGTTPRFTYTNGTDTGKDALNITGGRWRGRVGLRYLFN